MVEPLGVGMGGEPSARPPIRFERCTTHKSVGKLVSSPGLNVRMLRCTRCSGCQECRQPVPLVILEGTGGSGCSAEVGAKAQALHAATASKASSSKARHIRGTVVR
jgi:hypothetical protein